MKHIANYIAALLVMPMSFAVSACDLAESRDSSKSEDRAAGDLPSPDASTVAELCGSPGDGCECIEDSFDMTEHSCHEVVAGETFLGTSANEIIFGTSSSDVIRGGAGNDIIFGFAGRDQLYGGPGEDEILDGPGKDEVFQYGELDFPQEVFEELDYGIYWFGDDFSFAKAGSPDSETHFDPDAPTVIYVHGWQNGTTPRMYREAFNWTDSQAPDSYYAQAWIDAGWNVGVMYWNQFADEGNVAHAEAKIWVADGPRDMRWRDADGEYHDGPEQSAGTLFYESYKSAMDGYAGDNIRIVGHSLGNQMAVSLTRQIVEGVDSEELDENLLPRRVALLDPFYSPGNKNYLGGERSTNDLGLEAIEIGKDSGVLYEMYRTSAVSLIRKNLINESAYAEVRPWHFRGNQLAEKHVAASWHYFWSFDVETPTIRGRDEPGLSAATSDARVKRLMDGNRKLVHLDGRRTETPDDDVFRLRRR